MAERNLTVLHVDRSFISCRGVDPVSRGPWGAAGLPRQGPK